MIDLNTERLVTLSQLARRLPPRRNDRPVHPSTVHRWRMHGVRGVRLECIRVGSAWCTSLESFGRWVQQLTALETPSQPATSPSLPSPHSAEEMRKVDDALDQAGI